MRAMPGVLLLVGLLCAWGVQAQQWRVERWTDSMSDQGYVQAVVLAKSGHTIAIGRLGGDQVWMGIMLPPRTFEQFDNGRAPVMRVDRLEPDNWELAKEVTSWGYGAPMYQWTPSLVRSVIWHGIPAQGAGKLVERLRSGKELRIRYYTAAGAAPEFTVPLQGAARAIDEALAARPK